MIVGEKMVSVTFLCPPLNNVVILYGQLKSFTSLIIGIQLCYNDADSSRLCDAEPDTRIVPTGIFSRYIN